MARSAWWAVLSASIAATVVAGLGIVAAGAGTDTGTIYPAVAFSQAPTSPDTTARTGEAPRQARAGVRPSVPEIGRRSAGLSSADRRATSVPVVLRVPSVDLEAPLDPVGVRSDGLMKIPDDGARVGWYRYGPSPGDDVGSAVLAGHVDTDEGLGVMAALLEVPIGARVEVTMEDRSVVAYEVIGRRTVPKDDLELDELFARTGPARLTLITCGGPWRPAAASYRDNVVVVAVPMQQR